MPGLARSQQPLYFITRAEIAASTPKYRGPARSQPNPLILRTKKARKTTSFLCADLNFHPRQPGFLASTLDWSKKKKQKKKHWTNIFYSNLQAKNPTNITYLLHLRIHNVRRPQRSGRCRLQPGRRGRPSLQKRRTGALLLRCRVLRQTAVMVRSST